MKSAPKTQQELEIMREGGRRLALIRNELAGMVAPGVKPTELSKKAAELIKASGMKPVVLGYEGFPDVICVSINEAIVHGVPTDTPIADGDVVKIDVTLGYKSLIVDSAVTLIAGAGTPDSQKLVNGTREALDAGIAAVQGGGTRVGDISQAVQDRLERDRLGVIRDLVGHGIGRKIHEDPNIPNYGLSGTGPVLKTGMTICIEPMASLGDWHVNITKNGTVAMRDGSLGAHFEHTVLVTEKSAEILTQV